MSAVSPIWYTCDRVSRMQAIWAYVKANNLQDPKDKRKFVKDPKLELIFKFPVNMFSLNTRAIHLLNLLR